MTDRTDSKEPTTPPPANEHGSRMKTIRSADRTLCVLVQHDDEWTTEREWVLKTVEHPTATIPPSTWGKSIDDAQSAIYAWVRKQAPELLSTDPPRHDPETDMDTSPYKVVGLFDKDGKRRGLTLCTLHHEHDQWTTRTQSIAHRPGLGTVIIPARQWARCKKEAVKRVTLYARAYLAAQDDLRSGKLPQGDSIESAIAWLERAVEIGEEALDKNNYRKASILDDILSTLRHTLREATDSSTDAEPSEEDPCRGHSRS